MKKIILLYSVLICSLVACNSTKKSDKSEAESNEIKSEVVNDSHTAKNSLDYYGVYEGITPCADCEGIKVTVTINKDETFLLKNVYLKNGKELSPSEYSGTYVWNEKGNIITLNEVTEVPTHFFVAEGKLVIVDAEGKTLSEELKEHYELKQIEVF